MKLTLVLLVVVLTGAVLTGCGGEAAKPEALSPTMVLERFNTTPFCVVTRPKPSAYDTKGPTFVATGCQADGAWLQLLDPKYKPSSILGDSKKDPSTGLYEWLRDGRFVIYIDVVSDRLLVWSATKTGNVKKAQASALQLAHLVRERLVEDQGKS